MTPYSIRNERLGERVVLMRGAVVVSTLAGALGQAIREPRITALLGYLLALEPAPFLRLFGFTGSAQQVSLETRHTEGTSIAGTAATLKKQGLIEANSWGAPSRSAGRP